MSFDLPAQIQLELESYAKDEHISPAEAAVKLIQDALKRSKKRKVKAVAPITDEEMAAFQKAYPGFGQFNLSDEEWSRVEKNINRMKKDSFPARA